MNKLDTSYQNLLEDILKNGVIKSDRTGTGTFATFDQKIVHNMSDGFPLLTTKKMAWKQIVSELLWFLRGDTNVKYLLEQKNYIWVGDLLKNYEKHNGEIDWGPFVTKQEAFVHCLENDPKFCEKWGDLGPIYPYAWRGWIEGEKRIDQIKNLIDGLINNPDSRRHIVINYDVGKKDQMVLPPCHVMFQCFIANGVLSLKQYQRSVDTFLGLPFNIASYGLLLLILCKITGYKPGRLIMDLGDTHIYLNHEEAVKEQLLNDSFPLCDVELDFPEEFWKNFDVKQFHEMKIENFKLKNYQSQEKIKAKLNN